MIIHKNIFEFLATDESPLEYFLSRILEFRDRVISAFTETLHSLMSTLSARTEEYLGSLETTLNITNVISSIGFVKVNKYICEEIFCN